MTENTQSGLMTELLCQADFIKNGIMLYLPIVDDSRSDLIFEINNKFYRVQVKTSMESYDGNSFSFSTRSVNFKGNIKEYQEQFDFYYTNHRNQGYLIPVADVGTSAKTLRLEAKDINNPAICWAKEYRIEKILSDLKAPIQKWEQHKEKNLNFCIDCGAPISKSATRCKECSELIRSEQIPVRGELKEMIRTMPFTVIGKKFNVSDNAVRKWCDKYNLPKTKSEINKISDEEWKDI